MRWAWAGWRGRDARCCVVQADGPDAKAQTDLSQQSVILRTWTLTTSLYLRGMDVGDEASVEDAALKIRESAEEFVSSLESLVEW